MRTPTLDDPKQARPEIVNAFAYGDENETLALPVDNGARYAPSAPTCVKSIREM